LVWGGGGGRSTLKRKKTEETHKGYKLGSEKKLEKDLAILAPIYGMPAERGGRYEHKGFGQRSAARRKVCERVGGHKSKLAH